MQASTPSKFDTFTRCVLGLSHMYNMIQSSPDFEDVRTALNDRVGWSIELFRSCLTINFISGGSFCMLCSLSFLVMAETIHVRYARLSPAELKECGENMGYITFSILLAALDIGSVVVRIAGLVALSGSPALATALVLVSTYPSIFPLLTYIARLFKHKKPEPKKEVEAEAGTMAH